jgi:hypothetical protein
MACEEKNLFNFLSGIRGRPFARTGERPYSREAAGSVGEINIWHILAEDLPLHKLVRVAKTERTMFSRLGWRVGV